MPDYKNVLTDWNLPLLGTRLPGGVRLLAVHFRTGDGLAVSAS